MTETEPRSRDIDTSIAAAKRLAPHVGHLQQKVLSYVASKIGGVTYDEVVRDVGLEKPTVAGRLNELRNKGLISDSGVRRKTRSGAPARVYVVTAKGREALQ